MTEKRGRPTRKGPPEPALRVIVRRLREVMSEVGDGQSRLDKIVRLVSGLMVAEVCSIYLRRPDGSLELFATEGLNPKAVHQTHLKRGEGLVGRCAELAEPVNEPDAQKHPAFSYRPETGEEIYHSLLAVPVMRAGHVLGVLTVQNRTRKEYSEEDVEVLQTTAMVLAEHVVSGAVAGIGPVSDLVRSSATVVRGQVISEGIALGHVVLHEPRVVVTELIAEDPVAEGERLEAAIQSLRQTIDDMLAEGVMARAGDHRDILEAYRMFAHDRGWLRRLDEAVKSGLSAEAAVERVQNDTRARMLRQIDPYWRERLRDLDDLSDRLLRILTGRTTTAAKSELPPDAVLIARTMGPAELLDYDRSRLRGLVLEDSGSQSHVAIVARALGIAAVGDAKGIIERADAGNPIVVDAESGEVHVRPRQDVVAAYADKVRFRARRQQQYSALRDRPAVTRDGARIGVHVNAGLQVDMPQVSQSGADGIGLFRTELEFMIAATFPRLERQRRIYTSILDQSEGKPVVFRTLDIGGDKVLPYLRQHAEQNPALGWRAIRMSLDRPALFRTQVRALLLAAAGRDLSLMLPMVSEAGEIERARTLIAREQGLLRTRGYAEPKSLRVGIMIEVPAVLHALDRVLPLVDFASVGSNDLLQFLFAADRTNQRVSNRYDPLSVSALRALGVVLEACRRAEVPVSVCGEMAGRPLEALALVALGYRSISMSAAAVGPVKAMILSLDASRAAARLQHLLASGASDLRAELLGFAKGEGVEI